MSLFAKTSLSSWATAFPAAVLVHAAAFGLAMVLGGSPSYGTVDGEQSFTISIEGESASSLIEIEPLRVDAAETVEYDPRAAIDATLPRTLIVEHKAETSAQKTTLVPRGDDREPVRLAIGGGSGPGERGTAGTLAFGDAGDEPLAASPLPAQDSGGARGIGTSNGKGDQGFGDGGISGTRSGGSASSRGGNDLFSQVADQMAAQHTRQRFALKGQPGFPSACRSGHARNGIPCEGSSEWRVTVGPEGGRPTKVEATRAMECELQNASIRKFLSDYKFPASGRTDVYIFPVEMRVAR
jgi:hypothetical protein